MLNKIYNQKPINALKEGDQITTTQGKPKQEYKLEQH